MSWSNYRAVGRLLIGPVILCASWVAVFMLFRGVLIGATWHLRSGATPELLAQSFLHGFRFDLAMAAALSLPFALWMIWATGDKPWQRRLRFGLFGVIAFLAIFTLAGEVEYYKEFQMRLGPLAFQFFGTGLENDRTILGMIWHGYPVVRWTLVCVAVTIVFVAVNRRWLRVSGVTCGAVGRGAATLVLAAGTAIAMRGGVQRTPLRWGNAMFSQNAYANAMAQNGVYALVNVIRHQGHSARANKWLHAMNHEQAFAVTRSIMLLPGEELLEPDKEPILRRSPPTEAPVRRRPKNVVVVIMESFSGRFCGATGGTYGATPRFDELAQHGVLFDRALSVSTHTAQGVFATLCSLPNLPDHDSLMKQPEGNQPFHTLPGLLRQKGFATIFLYNGLFSWDNKEGFFRSHGVERFIGRNDFVNPTFVDPDWGVSDHDVFNRALQEFDGLAKSARPFLGIILTLSNHAPFNLPKVPGLAPITGGGEQNNRLNGIHYADWALGEFMDQARQSPWFADTLFVFTGDHSFGVPPVLTPLNLLHEHVPILFYGPEILGETGERRSCAVGQLDIQPTILGILGADAPHESFGRNILRLKPDDPGHAYVKQSGDAVVGYVEGNYLIARAMGQTPQLFRFDLGNPPSASQDLAAVDPERAAEMNNRLTAFTVTGLHLLTDKR